jgi:hypothetical protein
MTRPPKLSSQRMTAGSEPTAPYLYRAYGLTFAVPFHCPGLLAVGDDAEPDVVVRPGAVARRLSGPAVSDDRWDAGPGRFLLRGGRRAGRFLVQGGNVTLERNPGADEETLARCFTQEVLPAVLRQRGLLVLHANAALTAWGVVVIAGESGAGKSTTLAALLERECTMLADDVTALALAADGDVKVLPGVAQMHLTARAVSGLGYELAAALVQPGRRMKSAMPTAASMAQAPGRLGAIYLLAAHTGSDVRVRAVTGSEKFNALQSCIYGPMLADEHPGAFPLIQAIMRTTPMYRLDRPAERWSVPEVTDALLGGERMMGVPAQPSGGR